MTNTNVSARKRNTILWGGALLLIGVFLLLVNQHALDPYAPTWQYVVAALCGLGGIAFLILFVRDVVHWWPIIPAFTLLTVGVIIFLTTQTAAVAGEVLGSILFFGIALAFAVIFLLDRNRWWAIIPMGVLLLVSATTALSTFQVSPGVISATLFIGMGFVFLLVYLLGPHKREVWWALVPATALVAFGLFTFVFSKATGDLQLTVVSWWPALLVLLGVFLLVRGVAMLGGRTLPAADLTLPSLPAPGELPAAPSTAVIHPQDNTATSVTPSAPPSPPAAPPLLEPEPAAPADAEIPS
ncbi:MAG: hypothetical protein WAV74_18445 [Anaerolineae bacterium]